MGVIRSDVQQALEQKFGFPSLREGQAEVIGHVLERGSALAVFPTGAGKSLCYQLPALVLPGVTVVVSPLIALMKDQIDFLKSRGIRAARLDSSLTAKEAAAIGDAVKRGALSLLYVAPERFNNERFLSLLKVAKIALFAVDEAHCISEWGHNFRPDYLKLAQIRDGIGAERVLALTATATPGVVEDVCRAFGIPKEQAVVTGFYRQNLRLVTTPVTEAERDDVLRDRLEKHPGSTIVYVTLQKTAERVAKRLTERGLPAAAYHAGLPSEDRARIQDAWMADPRGVVVATIAFGMGIDKADVRCVVHYNLPKSLESYSQEIGRAGRDGKPSHVELLACAADVGALEGFAYGDTPTPSAVRGLLDELFGMGDTFDVAPTELASRHDLRPIVLSTALTYLELDGVLAQGTPYYGTYTLRPVLEPEAIAERFQGERRTFVSGLFAQATKKRVLYTLDATAAARAMGTDRARIITALGYFEEQGWLEVEPTDVRKPYRRLRADEDVAALTAMLVARFEKREAQELARIGEVLAVVQKDGCQTNALVGHFGQRRDAPCGHCSYCDTGRAVVLKEPAPPPPLADVLSPIDLAALAEEHPRALGEPRQRARFLMGITSPALTKAKLGRHPLFGIFAERRFADVLAFASASSQ